MKKIVFIGGGHSNTLAIRILMQKISKLELNKQNEFRIVNFLQIKI